MKRVDCAQHTFAYSGVVYDISDTQVSGGSARFMTYYEAYFCTRCLFTDYLALPGRFTDIDKLKTGAYLFNARPLRHVA